MPTHELDRVLDQVLKDLEETGAIASHPRQARIDLDFDPSAGDRAGKVLDGLARELRQRQLLRRVGDPPDPGQLE